jgi:hypothetical protein
MMENAESNYCKKGDECGGYGKQCDYGKCDNMRCEEECDGQCYGSGDEMVEGMMRLGDKAFEKVLLEKIKAHIEKEQGKKLDAAAKAIYDACHLFYARKMKPDTEMAAAFEKIRNSMAME